MVIRLLFFFFPETDHVSYHAKDAFGFVLSLLERMGLDPRLVILCDVTELDFLEVGHLDRF